MKVLVFTPTFGDGPLPETLESVGALRFEGRIEREVSWHNPYPGADMRNVVAQYVRAWELARAGGYDGLLTVEHDMRVPADALQMLWDAAAPVAYGVYVLRHGAAVVNAWEYVPGSRNLGESLSLRRERLEWARRRVVVPVSGVGWGCTLIRREVFERVPIRAGADLEGPDITFAQDCLRLGIGQVAHFGVLCGHWDGQRWLDAGANRQVVHVRARLSVNASIDGELYRMAAGERYTLPDGETLSDLVRAGYVVRQGADDTDGN